MADLSGYQRMRFPDGHQVGDEWRTTCPNRDCVHDDPKYFLNMETGASWCHHCQFRSASWVGLIAKLEGLDGKEQIAKWIKDHRVELKDGGTMSSSTYKVRVPMDKRLPTGTKEIIPGDRFHQYLESRGFGLQTIRKHGILKCEEGWYKDRVIVPVREDGELVFFFDRTVDKNEKMKTMGIGSKGMYWPVDKREVVFNLDSIGEHDQTMIAEGVMDAISIGDNAVALLGKMCSTEQMMKILNKNPREIHICLDNDATSHALQLAGRFYRSGVDTYIRYFSNGDPNDYLVKGYELPAPVSYNKFNVMYRMKTLGGLKNVG